MRGAFTKFLFSWPMQIQHNDRNNPDKAKRYSIGSRRIRIIRDSAEFFGYQQTEQGEIVAFLNYIDPYARSDDIPSDVNIEYVAGKVGADGTCIIFSYIWFSSKDDAVAYAKRHGMTLV